MESEVEGLRMRERDRVRSWGGAEAAVEEEWRRWKQLARICSSIDACLKQLEVEKMSVLVLKNRENYINNSPLTTTGRTLLPLITKFNT